MDASMDHTGEDVDVQKRSRGEMEEVVAQLKRLLRSATREIEKARAAGALPHAAPIPGAMPGFGNGFALDEYLTQIETQLIENALSQTDGHITRAAALLGTSFRRLRYRIGRLEIKMRERAGEPSEEEARQSSTLAGSLDTGVRSAKRSGSPLTLVMAASAGAPAGWKDALAGMVRKSDEFFDVNGTAAVLMRETGDAKARVAVDRYASAGNGELDLCFSMASYPKDGEVAPEIIKTASRRLEEAMGRAGSTLVSGA